MKRRIIQFTHPGAEYPSRKPDRSFSRKSNNHLEWNEDLASGVRYWNIRNSHFRKFLFMNDAVYKTERSIETKRGSVTFWGEWEPHSNFSVHHSGDGEYMVHRPYIDTQCERPKKHNTDPYVFGSKFWYTDCKQKRYGNVRELVDGSLILFGTERPSDKTFLLDTVFVVKKRHTHDGMQNNLSRGLIDFGLDFATISRGGLDLEKRNFGFYEGQMFSDNNKYFSFVPCKPGLSESPVFHERAQLAVEEFGFSKISRSSNGTMRGAGSVCMSICPNGINKCKANHSIDEVHSLWRRVVQCCYEQGFALGVEMPEPESFEAAVMVDRASSVETSKARSC